MRLFGLLFPCFFLCDSLLFLLSPLLSFFLRKLSPSSSTSTASECSVTAGMAVLRIRGRSTSVMAEVLLALVCSSSTSSYESGISAVVVSSPC